MIRIYCENKRCSKFHELSDEIKFFLNVLTLRRILIKFRSFSLLRDFPFQVNIFDASHALLPRFVHPKWPIKLRLSLHPYISITTLPQIMRKNFQFYENPRNLGDIKVNLLSSFFHKLDCIQDEILGGNIFLELMLFVNKRSVLR